MDIPTGILKILICLHNLALFQTRVSSNRSKDKQAEMSLNRIPLP